MKLSDGLASVVLGATAIFSIALIKPFIGLINDTNPMGLLTSQFAGWEILSIFGTFLVLCWWATLKVVWK